MTGGRGHRGQVPNEEVSHRNRSVQDVMIEDLQTQDFIDREVEDHDFNSSFENPYHNRDQF